MAEDFIPAKPSPLVRKLIYALSPTLLPLMSGVRAVEYNPADLERLRQLEPHTVILTPNHPTLTEPMLMFLLSCEARQFFYYVTAREVFDQMYGIQGWVVQRLGSYSIIRGAIDRTSFKVTRELLAQKGNKLVIFPEGEVYLQTQTVLPFQPGVFQMAYWGLEDARKAGRTDDPFYLLPVAFTYRFTGDITPDILASLERLEPCVGVSPEPGEELYLRLRKVSLAVLRSLEREYGIKVKKADNELEQDLTGRMDAVKEAVLERVAAAAGLPLPRGDTLVERMRSLHTQVENLIRREPESPTSFERKLYQAQRQRAKPLIQDLYRLSNWIAAYDGYIRESPSQERMFDILVRMEKECFGSAKINPPRIAAPRLGEPLDLAPRWPEYEKNRRAEIKWVTEEMHRRVSELVGASPVPSELFA